MSTFVVSYDSAFVCIWTGKLLLGSFLDIVDYKQKIHKECKVKIDEKP